MSDAAGPRWPRKYAITGSASSSRSIHGCAKEKPESCDSQSGRFKLSSFHKTKRFLQKQLAVRGRRVVTRELDQVAAIQEISEQRFVVLGKF